MCGEMVRAILFLKKTETRRTAGLKELNKCPEHWEVDKEGERDGVYCMRSKIFGETVVRSPYGKQGDTLWVRESWRTYASLDSFPPRCVLSGAGVEYDAGGSSVGECDSLEGMGKTRPSMFMPRWASRITLLVKEQKLERLHKITNEGARCEGVENRKEYEILWKRLNGEKSWDQNPWLWVVKFELNWRRR